MSSCVVFVALLLLLATPSTNACPFAHLLKGHQFSHESLANVQHQLKKRQLNASAIAGEFVLTTRLKTQASQVFNQGFPIGWAVNGVETAEIVLTAGKTYKFTVQSTCLHPFYLTTDARGQGRAPLDTGFDLPAPANATPKVCDGRSVLFRPPPSLAGQDIYYQCLNHDNMGWKVTVRNQTICDKYTEALAATLPNANAVVGLIVDAVFDKILAPTSVVLEYFTGVVPANSLDFTAPANAARFQALRASFISFMGGALGCSDGSIPPYTGASMKEVHKNMPIGAFEYDFFVDAIVTAMRDAGVTADDRTAVTALLNSGPVRGDVCNFENCIPASLCDKYSGPDLTTLPNSNEVLMRALTDAAFTRIAGDTQLKGFFDGTIPTPSVNYLGNATALDALKRRFIAFLGRRDVLICPQSNFPQTNFTIQNLRTLHENMPITTDAFNRFNDHIIAAAAALNVTVEDRAIIRAVLNSTEPLICNQRGCSSVPNDIDTFFDISVASKPSFHPFFGRGFPAAFRVGGTFVQGLRLTVGKLYAFRNTQPCTHPLYLSFGTGAGSTEVTAGVENPGQLFCGGRLLLFRPQASLIDKVMFASCRNHELMSFRVCVTAENASTPCSFATPLSVSPCDEAVNAVKAKLAGTAQLTMLDNAKKVLTAVVTDLFRTGAVSQPAPLAKYFNGTVPPGSTNYVGNTTNSARLVNGLVRWFGTKLTCTDNSIDIYDNGEIEPNMKIVHSRMGIAKSQFDIFNEALTALLQDVGGTGTGLSLNTAARVRIFLDSTSTDICATCSGYKLPSICEKWATLANVKQEALIKGAVVAVFTKLVAANATARPLFTGEVPCESRDFVNNTANQQAARAHADRVLRQPWRARLQRRHVPAVHRSH
jgi:truncated hemoglobin YjbI